MAKVENNRMARPSCEFPLVRQPFFVIPLLKGYEIRDDMESQASLARQMRDELAGIMQSDGGDEVEDDDRHQGWGD